MVAPRRAADTAALNFRQPRSYDMRSLYARALLFTPIALCAAARGAHGRQAAPALSDHEFVYESEDMFYSAEVMGGCPAGLYSTPASYENLLDVTFVAVRRGLPSPEIT
jgi:hypothetical protein